MGYPEDMLAPGEMLVLHRHPHWKTLFWPTVQLLVATLVASGLAGLVFSQHLDATLELVLFAVLAVLWLVVLIWRFLTPLIVWRSTHFAVTDRRVLVRHGVFTHSGIDIALNRVSDVQFRHTLWDRLFRTGTLILGSAAEEPLELADVPQVEQVHSLVYNQVFEVGEQRGVQRR